MKNSDSELIHRILSGNQEAFTSLVSKYQKRVHALIWKKTGDFHVAEEITQDTFLRAYRKLGSLKNPNLFAGWLYVIADRLTNTWFQKKRPRMRSLDAMTQGQIDELFYSKYVEKHNEELASERRVDLVKRLLSKLPESERIVITLHYLAGSSVKEISEFLGVSLNTVKSRLHRARKRLQKEDNMVRETLGILQPITNLTEDIMRTIKDTGAHIDSAVPSGSRPLVPWVIATSMVLFVVLMLGIGANNFVQFQQPYSLDSTSEMTVDIVDASVMLNLPSNPEVRNQVGNINAPDNNDETNQNIETNVSSSASGKIVDNNGKPVNDVQVALFPLKDGDGAWFPITIGDQSSIHEGLQAFPAKINRKGNFTIKDFNDKVMKLGLLPYYRPVERIVKIQIGDLYLFPNKLGSYNGVVLQTKQQEIKNVEITVQDEKHNIARTRQKLTHRNSSSISGRVVDTDGNPVVDLPIFISPHLIPEEAEEGIYLTAIPPEGLLNFCRGQTDVDGQFTITGVTSVPQYLSALPYNIDQRLPEDFETILKKFISRTYQLPFHRSKPYIKEFEEYGFGTDHYDYEPDVEIVSLTIDGITYYPHADFDEIPFGIVPGKHIKNVVVTVQPRGYVKGRVIFKDGTPLTNDRILLSYNYSGNNRRGSSTENKLWVDADGYFIHYLDEKDSHFSYQFTIEYQGHKATSTPITLKPGQRYDDLIFRLK
ncbi:MAG: RNA polymerase sigma factor [Candidatus Poribacteria bacterium]|nr:RNA polymerase sigma factor [Candidatus Poribacteria bacterium]